MRFHICFIKVLAYVTYDMLEFLSYRELSWSIYDKIGACKLQVVMNRTCSLDFTSKVSCFILKF